MKRRPVVLAACCALTLALGGDTAAIQQAPEDGVARLLLRLEQVMQAGRPDAYLDLLSASADRDRAADTAQALVGPGITRAVIRERDRVPFEGTLPGDGHRLMVEIFVERGTRGRVSTWEMDVRRIRGEQGDDWAVAGQRQIGVIDGLYRLALNPRRQYRATDLVVHSEDLEIRMRSGRVFVAETDEGPTAAVLLPDGDPAFTFKPSPQTEREQVKLYAGEEAVSDRFDAVFLRFNPGQFAERFPEASLRDEPVDPARLRRAEAVFRDEIDKSFSLDMSDLSRENWSLTPTFGDLIAEIRGVRQPALTYAKSSHEAEDISFFDRKRRRNISVYASKANIERNGRFFDEDESVPYDITDYMIEATLDPERQGLDARARLRLLIRDAGVSNLTLKLADPLAVHGIYSLEFGRLLFLRVRHQNSVVVNLPGTVTRGGILTLIVQYGGRLEPSMADREAVAAGPQDPSLFQWEQPNFPGEPSLLYTGRSYWYPQAPVTDYAPALLRLTVPDGYGVLASGELTPGSPVAVPPAPGQRLGGRQYVFAAPQPLRYLACLVSRFVRTAARTVALKDVLPAPDADDAAGAVRPLRPGVFYDSLRITVDANPRQQGRARRLAESAEDVARFYAGLVGDSPYPSLAVGLIEKELPGGHSPAYLSVIHQPLPQTTFSWSNDPAAFPSYPEFFLAHEIAHQWWGQAVGWRSYHEQWISEGFAQYFAALYAQRSRGDAVFQDVMRRMARFARSQSAQGPISLGYRLGHIKGDSRVFRSLVYNKSAVVLHALRQLLGDDVFFRGMRRFYFDARFKKAGTDDVRRAFERESGQDLAVFFENWIHTSGVPVVRFAWSRDGEGAALALTVRVEQVGSVFDLPLPLTIRYADGTAADLVVPVRERLATHRIPLKGDVAGVDVNAREAALVDVYR